MNPKPPGFLTGRYPVVLVLGLLTLFLAGPAAAHTDPGLSGGFLAGFGHPLRGVDHLLAMVAVGIWGAILGRPLVVLLPLIFPTVMAPSSAILNLSTWSLTVAVTFNSTFAEMVSSTGA